MMKDIGRLLFEAREARNYSQADVRHLLGWSKSRLSRIETGAQPANLNDYMQCAVLFSQEFAVKTMDYMSEVKAEIYARLCDLLEAEQNRDNPKSFKRLDNLKALKIDLETLHATG